MEYYSAEKEAAINKKYKKSSLIVLIIGLVLGGGLLTIGIIKANSEPKDGLFGIFGKVVNIVGDKVDEGIDGFGDETTNQEKLKEKEAEKAEKETALKEETTKLTAKKDELLALDPKTANGFSYEFAMSADDGDAYTLKIIIDVLDDSTLYCWQDEYTSSEVVGTYCSLNNKINNLESEISDIKWMIDANNMVESDDGIAKIIDGTTETIDGVANVATKTVSKTFNRIQSRFYIYPGMFILFVTIAISAYIWFGARKKALGQENHPQGSKPETQEVTEQKGKK